MLKFGSVGVLFIFEISLQVINTKVNKNTFKVKSNLSHQEPVSPAL